MKIIAGLGNPGADYAHTKHNVGFMLADALADRWNAPAWKQDFFSSVTEVRIGGEKVFLVKPLTYMNSSGEALGPMLSYYKLGAENLTVVHDDMDIPVGTVRIRKKGSSGGHNGIKSILSHVDSEAFARVRIGIGRPPTGWTVINHVLAPFAPEDTLKIREAIAYLLPAVTCIVTDGTDFAMNRYNPHRKKKNRQEDNHETNENDDTSA